MLIISGCTQSIQSGKKAKIDYSLEEFNFKSLNSLSLSHSIAFEWQKSKSTKVKGYIVFRGSIDAKKMKPIAIIRDRYVTSFVDTKLKPKTTYLYKFTTLGRKDVESPHSGVKPFSTRDSLPSISYIEGVSNLPRRAKIIWRPHKNPIVNSYDVYKKSPKDKDFRKIANVAFNLSSSYIDTKVKDNTEYYYFIVPKTYGNGSAKSSKKVKIKTKQIPLEVSNIMASKKLPRKINLSWEYKSNDVSAYKIYVSNQLNKEFKFLSVTNKKSFSHKVGNGVRKYYKITAVDRDELESSFKLSKSILGKSLVIPATPVLEEYILDINNNGVSLRWSTNPRYKTFIVLRNDKKIATIKENSFLDKGIISGNTYKYKIIAMDKFSIQSKPSVQIEVRLPKSVKAK